MAQESTTISISNKIKLKAQKASEEVFGEVNVSGYLKILINKDCKERGIE